MCVRVFVQVVTGKNALTKSTGKHQAHFSARMYVRFFHEKKIAAFVGTRSKKSKSFHALREMALILWSQIVLFIYLFICVDKQNSTIQF